MSRPTPIIRVEGPALNDAPPRPTAGGKLTLTSDSPAESCTVVVSGLGPGWRAQRERVAVSGTTPAQTFKVWLRVNRASFVDLAYTAAGRIGITHPSGGELAHIDAGDPCAWLARYSLPDDTQARPRSNVRAAGRWDEEGRRVEPGEAVTGDVWNLADDSFELELAQ